MCQKTVSYCFADVNECDYLNGKCTQLCVNFIGGFNCSCLVGYTLAEDGFTCRGEWQQENAITHSAANGY